MTSDRPLGYSTTQIVLHWLIAALVLFQAFVNEGIKELWEAVDKGEAVAGGPHLHVAIGMLIFALAVWRVVLRLMRGAPPAPAGEHPALKFVAVATHVLLYALIFIMPLSGAMAWFFGVGQAAGVHATLKVVLLALVALHIVGALAHMFVFRTGVMRRILVPQKD